MHISAPYRVMSGKVQIQGDPSQGEKESKEPRKISTPIVGQGFSMDDNVDQSFSLGDMNENQCYLDKR